MTNFQIKEKGVANFETALRNAGMQDAHGTESAKPRYYRGVVDNINDNVYLNFLCTDNLEILAADNKTVRRSIYINGSLYCRNGSNDSEYQDLAEAIERECKKLGIVISFNSDGVETPIDTESPVYFCNFDAEQNILI